MPDYSGYDLYWYLDIFDMYDLLNCRILDRMIQAKWGGPHDVNAQMWDYSTSYVMATDPHGIFQTDLIFQEIRYKMFTLDRSSAVHGFKF